MSMSFKNKKNENFILGIIDAFNKFINNYDMISIESTEWSEWNDKFYPILKKELKKRNCNGIKVESKIDLMLEILQNIAKKEIPPLEEDISSNANNKIIEIFAKNCESIVSSKVGALRREIKRNNEKFINRILEALFEFRNDYNCDFNKIKSTEWSEWNDKFYPILKKELKKRNCSKIKAEIKIDLLLEILEEIAINIIPPLEEDISSNTNDKIIDFFEKCCESIIATKAGSLRKEIMTSGIADIAPREKEENQPNITDDENSTTTDNSKNLYKPIINPRKRYGPIPKYIKEKSDEEKAYRLYECWQRCDDKIKDIVNPFFDNIKEIRRKSLDFHRNIENKTKPKINKKDTGFIIKEIMEETFADYNELFATSQVWSKCKSKLLELVKNGKMDYKIRELLAADFRNMAHKSKMVRNYIKENGVPKKYEKLKKKIRECYPLATKKDYTEKEILKYFDWFIKEKYSGIKFTEITGLVDSKSLSESRAKFEVDEYDVINIIGYVLQQCQELKADDDLESADYLKKATRLIWKNEKINNNKN